jgi:hypothetical protein
MEVEGVGVDRLAGDLLVVAQRAEEVAQRLRRVADLERGQVLERVTEACHLEVEHDRELTGFEHELRDVTDEEGHPVAMERRVSMDPSDQELEDRLGPTLRVPVLVLVHAEVPECDLARTVGEHQPGAVERRRIEPVHARQNLHVLVQDRRPLLVRFGRREVGTARRTLLHDRQRLGAQAVHVRDGNLLCFQHLQDPVLAQEGGVRFRLRAIGAHVQRSTLAVRRGRLDEPRRSPAVLAFECRDLAGELGLDPGGDPRVDRIIERLDHGISLTARMAFPKSGL